MSDDPRVEAMMRLGARKAAEAAASDVEPSPAELERQRFRRWLIERHRFGLLPAEGALVARDELFTTRALQVAKAWRATPKTYLTLVGNVGVGKSTAAAWVALELAQAGATPVLYCAESDVAEWHRFRSTRHQKAWAAAVEAAVLVIDEVGDVDAADRAALEHARAGMSQLDKDRRGRGGRTIVLGNVTPGELADRIDDRLLDRLQDDHHASIELVQGHSLRRRP